MSYETSTVFCIIPPVLLAIWWIAHFMILPRRRMELRASRLLAQHPDAEQTSVYLELHSAFAGGKQREMDAKIAEMQPRGWTFLRAVEANPLRTIRSCGGGLTLHFIRTKAG